MSKRLQIFGDMVLSYFFSIIKNIFSFHDFWHNFAWKRFVQGAHLKETNYDFRREKTF